MLQHSVKLDDERRLGGDLSGRAYLRELDDVGANVDDPTASAAAFAALFGVQRGEDVGAVFTSWEALLELESNRYPTAALFGTRYGDALPTFAAATAPPSSTFPVLPGGEPIGLLVERRTATDVPAYADVTRADDGGTALATPVPAGDAYPVGYDVTLEATVKGRSAPASGHGWTFADGTTVPTVNNDDAVWPAGGLLDRAFTVSMAQAQRIARAPWSPSPYRFETARTFTAAGYVSTVAGWADLRFRVRFETTAGVGITVTGPTFRVGTTTSDGLGYTARTEPLLIPADPNTGRRRMRLEVEIVATEASTTSVRFSELELYAGRPRPIGGSGRRAMVAPYGGAGIVLDYRDGLVREAGGAWQSAPVDRRLSRVDVHGDATLGHVTSASVYTAPTESDAALVWAGTASSAGRLSVSFPGGPRTVRRLVLLVEEATTETTGLLFLSQLDGQLVLDVSDRVISCEIESTREAEPGASSSVSGSFQTSTVTLALDNSDRELSPSRVESIDVGHRIETAVRVHYADPTTGAETVEVFPAGVFYSDAWDAPSDSTVATIEGVDLLGHRKSTDVAATLYRDADVASTVVHFGRFYLDLGADEIATNVQTGYVASYLYPTGNLGTYLADLANAIPASLEIDRLERLRLVERGIEETFVAAELTEANAIVRVSTPRLVEQIRTVVKVTARPLALAPVGEVYQPWRRDEPIVLAPGEVWRLTVLFDKLVDPLYSSVGYFASNSLGLRERHRHYHYGSDLVFENLASATSTTTIEDVILSGVELVERPILVETSNASAVRRYGRRELAIEGRLVQTPERAALIAEDALATYAGVTAQGRRVSPDVTVESLGLAFAELGDRYTIAAPNAGVTGDYRAVAHTLSYDEGRLLSTIRARRIADVVVAVADVDVADDVARAGI